jgi:hypothetical protein
MGGCDQPMFLDLGEREKYRFFGMNALICAEVDVMTFVERYWQEPRDFKWIAGGLVGKAASMWYPHGVCLKSAGYIADLIRPQKLGPQSHARGRGDSGLSHCRIRD